MGFGVANRNNGTIVYPANDSVSHFIQAKGQYIILGKGKNEYKILYGMINSNGKKILDFKYDRIGSVLVPLPDSLITVQLNNRFGVFNTNTEKLSEIKFDNSGNWLNDGHSYHEGGAHIADSIIYKQLGIINFKKIYILPKNYSDEVIINKDKSEEQYLISKKRGILPKKYLFLNKITYYEPLYFVGAIDPYNYELINQTGEPIDKIDNSNPKHDDYYIRLNEIKYYFIETNTIVTIPKNYKIFVDCYSKNGFIGFINDTDPRIKLFIDKYGNKLYFR